MIPQPHIIGFGAYVPARVVTNADIAAREHIAEDWIVSRTGIEARRIVAPGETGTDMASAASLKALAHAGRTPEDITHIVYATCTPDAASPSAACSLEAKLSISGRTAFDLNAACAGFINGLEVSRALIALHPAACVLLVASESLSHRCNWDDHATAVLFGDGAGAAIITGNDDAEPASDQTQGNDRTAVVDESRSAKQASPVGRIKDVSLGSDGKKGQLLLITGGFSAAPYRIGDVVGPDYCIRMDGGLVYKHAVRNMTADCKKVLERNGLTPEDVDLFIPHQANLRIIEGVGARLGIAEEKVFLNVQKYGNTSAASIPIALSEAAESGALRPGMRVLLTSFGGGLTWGSALLQF